MAAVTQWLAAQDSAHSQPASTPGPVQCYCLQRIIRAARREATVIAKPGSQQILVGVNELCEESGQHAHQCGKNCIIALVIRITATISHRWLHTQVLARSATSGYKGVLAMKLAMWRHE